MADTKRTSKKRTSKQSSSIGTSSQPLQASSTLAQELGKRNPFDLLEEEVFVSLIRTCDLLTHQVPNLFAEHDLTPPLYNALRIVGGEQKVNAHGITVGTISQRLVCRQPDTTRLVDRLEALGYVRRDSCKEDARRRMVRITPRGEEVLKSLHRPVRELHRKQFAHISRESLHQLNHLLQQVRDGLKIT